jgi:hypothetical protein
MDDDLETMDCATLIAALKRLRAGIRDYREGLLPEPIPADIAAPAWPNAFRGLRGLPGIARMRTPRRPRMIARTMGAKVAHGN